MMASFRRHPRWPAPCAKPPPLCVERGRSHRTESAEVERQFSAERGFRSVLQSRGAGRRRRARRIARGSTLDLRVARLMWIAGLPRPMRAIVVAGLRRSGQHWMARVVHAARPRSADAYWQLIERKNQLVSRGLTRSGAGIQAIICPPHAFRRRPISKRSTCLLRRAIRCSSTCSAYHPARFPQRESRQVKPAAGLIRRDHVLRNAQRTDHGSVGLPVGVQVSSLPWREDIVLAMMKALESSSSVTSSYPGSCVVPLKKISSTGIAIGAGNLYYSCV